MTFFASPKGNWPTDTFVGPSVRPRFPKTPPGGAPIRAKIGGDVQRGRGMKAVKTTYE